MKLIQTWCTCACAIAAACSMAACADRMQTHTSQQGGMTQQSKTVPPPTSMPDANTRYDPRPPASTTMPGSSKGDAGPAPAAPPARY